MYKFDKNLEGKNFVCKTGEIVLIMAIGNKETWISIYNKKTDDERFTTVDNGYLDIALMAGRLQPYCPQVR